MCFRPSAASPGKTCPKCGAACLPNEEECSKCGAKLPAVGPAGMPTPNVGAPGTPGAPAAPGTPPPPGASGGA